MMPSETYRNENVSNENEIETSIIISSFSQLIIVQTYAAQCIHHCNHKWWNYNTSSCTGQLGTEQASVQQTSYTRTRLTGSTCLSSLC